MLPFGGNITTALWDPCVVMKTYSYQLSFVCACVYMHTFVSHTLSAGGKVHALILTNAVQLYYFYRSGRCVCDVILLDLLLYGEQHTL